MKNDEANWQFDSTKQKTKSYNGLCHWLKFLPSYH